jgi:hypothetical protein
MFKGPNHDNNRPKAGSECLEAADKKPYSPNRDETILNDAKALPVIPGGTPLKDIPDQIEQKSFCPAFQDCERQLAEADAQLGAANKQRL